MYGTVARFTLKPGTAERFEEVAKSQEDAAIPGYLQSSVFRSETRPNEYWLAVVFDSKEAYVKNADAPEQHQRYQELAQFFAADPEWHDGALVYATAAT